MSLDITEIPETEIEEDVNEEEVAPVEEVEDIEEPPAPKKRGRPAGAKNKAKTKPKQAFREIPMNTPEPQVDLHALTNMLAQHLAAEKTQARERRHANWSGFF